MKLKPKVKQDRVSVIIEEIKHGESCIGYYHLKQYSDCYLIPVKCSIQNHRSVITRVSSKNNSSHLKNTPFSFRMRRSELSYREKSSSLSLC